MKNYALGAALILVMAFLISVGPNILAQVSTVTLNIQAPPQASTDQTPILAPNSNIRPFLQYLTDKDPTEYGGFFVQKYAGGPVYAFLKAPADERGELSLFEYDPEGKEFWWYDCTAVWFDTETKDIGVGIMQEAAYADTITVENFKAYYGCDVDDWTNDPEYTEAKSWLDNLSMREIITQSAPDITKLINSNQATLATKGQGSALQQSEDDLAPGDYSLDNSTAIAFSMDDMYKGNSAGMAMPFGYAASSSKPIHYVIRDAQSNEQYLLQIWRFAPFKGNDGKDYVKMGIRLFARGDSGRKALWPIYTASSDAFEVNSNNQVVPASAEGHAQDLLMLVPQSPDGVILTTNLLFKNGKNRGQVRISLEYDKVKISKITIDASEDLKFIGPRPLRLKFSQDMIAELIKNPSFSNAINDASKIYEGSKVRIQLSRIGEPNVAFTTIPKTTPSGSTTTNNPEGPYFKSDPIKPNDYVMEIEVDGFKPFTRKIRISSNSLSSNNDQLISLSDVKEIEAFPLLTDPCSVCQSITECLACVDQGIVSNYTK